MRLNWILSRHVRQIISIIKFRWTSRSLAGAITEVGVLVHIKPYSRKSYFFVKKTKHVSPIKSSIWMEKIYKSCCSRPNFASKLASISIFHENSSSLALSVGDTTIYFYASINNRNIMILWSNVSHSVKWKSWLINCKIFIIYHVVYIAPNSV